MPGVPVMGLREAGPGFLAFPAAGRGGAWWRCDRTRGWRLTCDGRDMAGAAGPAYCYGQEWCLPGAGSRGGRLGGGPGMVTEQPALTFAGMLRRLRAEARLTQEELAAAAGVSPR